MFGEVVGTREIQLKGTQTKHRLVKIKNNQGNTIVVNVGDATRTPDGRFKKGASVMAIGKAARINGKPVIFAKYIGDMRPTGFWGKAVAMPAKGQKSQQ